MTRYEITVDGETFEIEIGDLSSSTAQVRVNGQTKTVTYARASSGAPDTSAPKPPEPPEAAKPVVAPAMPKRPVAAKGGTATRAPMPGKILAIVVEVGDTISDGATVCTLEAMKMEMPISATSGGTVQAIHVRVGQVVANDDPLVTVG